MSQEYDDDLRRAALGEEWRWIPGRVGWYSVSNTGKIRSHKHIGATGVFERSEPRLLSPALNSNGYPETIIGRDHERVLIHRAVAEAFHGPCPQGMECAHLDGVRTNNHAGNLRWVTRKENHSHMKLHGTELCGEKVHTAKLTVTDVRKIRQLYASGCGTGPLSREYAVTRETIRNVVKRKCWKDVA